MGCSSLGVRQRLGASSMNNARHRAPARPQSSDYAGIRSSMLPPHARERRPHRGRTVRETRAGPCTHRHARPAAKRLQRVETSAPATATTSLPSAARPSRERVITYMRHLAIRRGRRCVLRSEHSARRARAAGERRESRESRGLVNGRHHRWMMSMRSLLNPRCGSAEPEDRLIAPRIGIVLRDLGFSDPSPRFVVPVRESTDGLPLEGSRIH